jgi:hypothetical protein
MFAEAIIIIGVNDGEFTLRQRYPPEGVPIAHPPIQKNKESYQPFYPRWNFDSNLDVPAPLLQVILNEVKNPASASIYLRVTSDERRATNYVPP